MGRSRSRSRSRTRARVRLQAHKIPEIALKTLSKKIFCIQAAAPGCPSGRKDCPAYKLAKRVQVQVQAYQAHHPNAKKSPAFRSSGGMGRYKSRSRARVRLSRICIQV
jgi:hypothetical protein